VKGGVFKLFDQLDEVDVLESSKYRQFTGHLAQLDAVLNVILEQRLHRQLPAPRRPKINQSTDQ